MRRVENTLQESRLVARLASDLYMSKFGFSAMTFAHVGYITKFLWGQRHPPGDSEVE